MFIRKSVLTISVCLLTAAVCVAAKVKWTYSTFEGEDATSCHYYFFRVESGSPRHVRWVWNGGAQNAPTVKDYIIEADRITFRESEGRRDSIKALTAGRDAPLKVKDEHTIVSKNIARLLAPPASDSSLTKKQRQDLQTLIELLEMERDARK